MKFFILNVIISNHAIILYLNKLTLTKGHFHSVFSLLEKWYRQKNATSREPWDISNGFTN